MIVVPKLERTRDASHDDLLELSGWLYDNQVSYAIGGGWATAHWVGDTEYAGDVDLIPEPNINNYRQLRKALMMLPGRRILRMTASAMLRMSLIRLRDEILVDVMRPPIKRLRWDNMERIPRKVGDAWVHFVSGDQLTRMFQQWPGHAKLAARADLLISVGYDGSGTNRII